MKIFGTLKRELSKKLWSGRSGGINSKVKRSFAANCSCRLGLAIQKVIESRVDKAVKSEGMCSSDI